MSYQLIKESVSNLIEWWKAYDEPIRGEKIKGDDVQFESNVLAPRLGCEPMPNVDDLAKLYPKKLD